MTENGSTSTGSPSKKSPEPSPSAGSSGSTWGIGSWRPRLDWTNGSTESKPQKLSRFDVVLMVVALVSLVALIVVPLVLLLTR